MAAAVAALVALVVLVVLELTDSGFRAYLAAHPLLTGVVSGLLLIAPLLLAVERTLERSQQARERESERRELNRWRRPAEDALLTYLDVAVSFTGELRDMLQADAAQPDVQPLLDIHTATAEDYARVYKRIAITAPDESYFFLRLNRVADAALARSGAAAIGAVGTVARYPDLSPYIERVSEAQRVTRELVDCCYAIYIWRRASGLIGQEKLQRALERLAELTARRYLLLQTMRRDIRADMSAGGSFVGERPHSSESQG